MAVYRMHQNSRSYERLKASAIRLSPERDGRARKRANWLRIQRPRDLLSATIAPTRACRRAQQSRVSKAQLPDEAAGASGFGARVPITLDAAMTAGEAALDQAIEQPSTTQPGDGGDDDATDSQARTSQPGVTAADAAARSPLLQTQKCVGAHMLIISLQSHAHAVAALTASAYLLAVSCAHVEPHEHIRTAKCELAPPHSAVRAQLMSSRLTCNETGAQEREAAVACASSPGGRRAVHHRAKSSTSVS